MKTILPALLASLCALATAQELPSIDWDALSETNPWAVTEIHRDVPVVAPGDCGQAPSDAIVLFDGGDLSAWSTTPFGEGVRMDRTETFLERYQSDEAPRPAAWAVEDGAMVAGSKKGAIATRRAFGDMQLHIEWLVPELEGKSGQDYGNSGIFLMGLYEIQVLNSYRNPTYANGQAGAIYKQHIPLVNASKPPGEWQSYDVLFTAPRFSDKGNVISPAMVTVLHNGALILYNAVIHGPTSFIGEPYYVPHPEKLPIVLQDHDNPVRFRNIWAREL